MAYDTRPSPISAVQNMELGVARGWTPLSEQLRNAVIFYFILPGQHVRIPQFNVLWPGIAFASKFLVGCSRILMT
jgi:hypothetical protein